MYSATLLIGALALVNAQSPAAPSPPPGGPIDGPVIPGTTGKLGDAQVTTDDVPGAAYVATLPDKSTTSVRGSISATSASNGKGVNFVVSLSGLPDPSLGPFLYHIHAMPVPANGNCTATGAHLDPYVRGEIPPCDNTQPQTCQVGDLAGKHGNITSSPFSASFLDPYVSTNPGSNATLVGKSIVIHTQNATRLTCANFLPVSNGTSSSNTTSSTATPAPFIGAAATNFASFSAVVAAVLGLGALLL